MATNEQWADYEAVGITVDRMTDDERQVLASLSPEEKQTLISVSQRLTEARGDVQGYARVVDDGGIIY